VSTSLLTATRAAGVKSVRALRQVVKTTSPSAREAARLALLHKAFLDRGGVKGPLGFPLTRVSARADGSLARAFEGGELRLAANGSNIVVNEKLWVVHFVGLECMRESKRDQSTPSDEPFVIWFVQSGSRVSPNTRVSFEDINKGSKRTISNSVISADINSVGLPLIVHAIVMEHDQGDRQQAANKINELARDAVAIANEVVDQVNNYSGSTTLERLPAPVNMPIISKTLGKLLNLQDDVVGTGLAEIFIVQPGESVEQLNARIRSPQHRPDKFDNKATYTHSFEVDGGKAGRYHLYFRVEIENDPNNFPT
jgi:hypothetical protein